MRNVAQIISLPTTPARRVVSTLGVAMLMTLGVTVPIRAAEDHCASILKDGVHNESRSSRTVVVENTTKRYVCTHKGQALADAKALELGFMIRFFGVRIGLGKDVVTQWIDRNCSDNGSSERQSTEETNYSRSADKALADAWLRCKTLRFKSNSIGVTDEIDASDRTGRAYRFRIAIVGFPYYWDKASTTVAMDRGKPLDILTVLRSRAWTDAMGPAKDVLPVGTASCGGSKDKEVQRALMRANRLREWIDTAHGRPIVKGTINLGKYQDEFCAEGSSLSDMQRPILVLLVTERPNQQLRAIDYQSALMDAATTHPAFQFERYSNFDIALR